jgi:hypothetical protein
MMDIVKIEGAVNLTDEWDRVADHYFQKRAFLAHCETGNPCRQRYYLARQDGRLVAGAVLYSLRLSLLTFARADLPVSMEIAGIPCSVSRPGLIGSSDAVRDLLDHLRTEERGFLLALNLEAPGLIPEGFTHARTLPTLVLEAPFRSWDEYLGAMRADYRRRVNQILAHSEGLKIGTGTCEGFSRKHHDLYLQVWGRSEAKLEKLTLDFFRRLPGEFRMITAHHGDRLAGWAIILETPDGLDFFLGGIDYDRNQDQAVYLRLLLEIVRTGIDAGVSRIDLGQTAEIPKMRLGAGCRSLQMGATHSNTFFRFLLRRSTGFLEYQRQVPEQHVFGVRP